MDTSIELNEKLLWRRYQGCHLHSGFLVFRLLVAAEDPSPWMEKLLVDEDEEKVDQGGDGNDDGQHPGEVEQQTGRLFLFREGIAFVQHILVLFPDIGSCKK